MRPVIPVLVRGTGDCRTDRHILGRRRCAGGISRGTFWKSELIDFVILQQDAFDDIDGFTSMERQEYMLDMVIDI